MEYVVTVDGTDVGFVQLRFRSPARRQGVLALSALAFGGCDIFGPRHCSLEARPAVSVDVRDSVTGERVGRGPRIVVREGAYADTARFPSHFEGPFPLARERPGTYVVTVEQDGYRPWTRSGVRATRDDCHVRTAAVTARLQR